MNPARAALAAGLALLLAAAPARGAAPAGTAPGRTAPVGRAPVGKVPVGMVRYVVRPGETPAELAARGLIRPHEWRSLEVVRRGGARKLVPGQVILIPAALLRREPLAAEVVAFSGAVTLDPGGPAHLGLAVGEGSRISTGANSFVTLGLADGSRITLPSQSRIKVEVLRRLALDGRLERSFSIESGRGNFTVTPAGRAEDRFLVRTPVAVAAVRGTKFRVAHDDVRASSVVTVIEGEVASRAAAPIADKATAAELPVAAGEAALVDGLATRRADMLPPPALERPGLLQQDDAVSFTVAGPPPAAMRLRGQLARDAGFVDLFAEAETTGRDLAFDSVGNGRLFVRLTAIDGDGVEGEPASYAFERYRNGLDLEAGALPGSPDLTLFRWRPRGTGVRLYDFVLARDAGLTNRVVDAPGLERTELTIANLEPGDWFWRVTVTVRDGARRWTRVLPVKSLTIAPVER